jgi:hypothetical protein
VPGHSISEAQATGPRSGPKARLGTLLVMDDERWEPGMPVLDRQAVGAPVLPPSLQGLPPRSVPETRPTPLQPYYVYLSVIVLICGAVAITALEFGAPLGSPLVKLCALIGLPLLVATTADATVRIWRSAWAWLPVNRTKGLFRFAWVGAAVVGLVALTAGALIVIAA